MEEGEAVTETMEGLRSRVAQMEAREKDLLERQRQMEDDFGQRRAKLKELYLQKEEELRKSTETQNAVDTEIEMFQAQIRELQNELEEARSAVTIAQCTAENDIAVEQRKCQEEIATLQQLMKEEVTNAVGHTGERYEGEVKRLKKVAERLEAEKQHYRRLYERQLEEADIRGKGESLLSPGVLTAVTKSLAKRVPSLNPAGTSLTTPEKTTPTHQTPNATTDADNLEDSMKKAQEDAAVLRSLVEPLEEEILALKQKLRAQDAQLRAHEAQQAASLHTAELVAPLLEGRETTDLVKELDVKLKGMSTTLEAEKASRADLELYTAILNTQKTALTEDVDRLRNSLAELRLNYEDERRQHRELKHTWQRANDQFLASQRLHLADMSRMQSVLTSEQLTKLEEIQRKEEQQQKEASVSTSGTGGGLKAKTPSMNSLQSIGATPTTPSRSPAPRQRKISGQQQQECGDDDSVLLDLSESGSQSGAASDDGDSENLAARFSPDKIPQLTRDQQKALLDVTTPDKESATGVALSSGEDQWGEEELALLSAGGRRVVSETEWLQLHQEIQQARARIGKSCKFCSKYQTQINKVQSDYRELEKQKTLLEKALERHKEDLDREAEYRHIMEDKWKNMAEEYEKKVKELSQQIEVATGRHNDMLARFKDTVRRLKEQLQLLIERRELAQQELNRLQKENDTLIGKHSAHSQELQNEFINLPDNMEEMQLLLLRYREDIIAAKVSKEHLEETLKSEILFLKDQVLAEQHEKNTIEDRLSSEIDQLREKVGILESKESEMEGERRGRVESDARLRETESKQIESNVKSQQIIAALKTQCSEQTQVRTRLDAEVIELKGRVSALQHDLDTSEAVQRDFVRLSQSLQVQLEKIRQSESEVRWQHEEDVEDCGSCHQRFSAMGRRKDHLPHKADISHYSKLPDEVMIGTCDCSDNGSSVSEKAQDPISDPLDDIELSKRGKLYKTLAALLPAKFMLRKRKCLCKDALKENAALPILKIPSSFYKYSWLDNPPSAYVDHHGAWLPNIVLPPDSVYIAPFFSVPPSQNHLVELDDPKWESFFKEKAHIRAELDPKIFDKYLHDVHEPEVITESHIRSGLLALGTAYVQVLLIKELIDSMTGMNKEIPSQESYDLLPYVVNELKESLVRCMFCTTSAHVRVKVTLRKKVLNKYEVNDERSIKTLINSPYKTTKLLPSSNATFLSNLRLNDILKEQNDNVNIKSWKIINFVSVQKKIRNLFSLKKENINTINETLNHKRKRKNRNSPDDESISKYRRICETNLSTKT